jgi:hypothetical protein
MCGGLILLHEYDTQGGSLGGVLVCAGTHQLCGYASLASSHGEIVSSFMIGLGDYGWQG